MTLAALIRGKPKAESGALATAIPATAATKAGESGRAVARVVTVAVANRPEHETVIAERAFRWQLHFSDCDPLQVTFAPALDHADVLASYPDAVGAEPVPEPPAVAIPGDVAALFDASERAGLYDDTDRAALPAMVAIDADGTRALVADMQGRIGRCTRCRYLRKPGLSGGYCNNRDDLLPVYGILRALPDDGGAWCSLFEATQ